MTKIKLLYNTVINASTIELINGALQITTSDYTVEELANLFSNKSNTSLITLLTEGDDESGYKEGFTSFAGIVYNSDGTKTIELFQPVDKTELRISNVGSIANIANKNATIASEKTVELEEQNIILMTTVDSILTDIIPSLSIQE